MCAPRDGGSVFIIGDAYSFPRLDVTDCVDGFAALVLKLSHCNRSSYDGDLLRAEYVRCILCATARG